jgi:hypothetical protein
MLSHPTNPKAVHLLTQIRAAQNMVALIENTLKSLQASCEHDFRVTSQGAYVYGCGRRDGDVVFRRDELCRVCCMVHKAEDDLPHCLDCNTPMPRASYDHVKQNLDEFEQVCGEGSLANDSFPMGSPYGYRCENCGRAHVYRAGGD